MSNDGEAIGNAAEVWQGHLAAIAAERITARAYAEREGLSVLTLYAWRQRLKQRAGRTRHHWAEVRAVQPPKAELQVGGSCTLALACGARLEMAGLPAPAWVAALATALSGAGR